MLKHFYIYRHIRNDNNQVFYIGKGTWTNRHKYDRAFAKDRKNPIWNAIVEKCGSYDVEYVMFFDNEEDCFAKERELIALYGRRDNNTGTLANLTDGGEGHLGLITSEKELARRRLVRGALHPNFGKKLSVETRRKKSEAISGEKHHLYGKKLPQSWRDNIAVSKHGSENPMWGKTGASHPNSRRVLNASTGIVYDSVLLASEAEGFKMKTLYNWLSGHRPNKTDLVFI